jgi:hypothetical protein
VRPQRTSSASRRSMPGAGAGDVVVIMATGQPIGAMDVSSS